MLLRGHAGTHRRVRHGRRDNGACRCRAIPLHPFSLTRIRLSKPRPSGWQDGDLPLATILLEQQELHRALCATAVACTRPELTVASLDR